MRGGWCGGCRAAKFRTGPRGGAIHRDAIAAPLLLASIVAGVRRFFRMRAAAPANRKAA